MKKHYEDAVVAYKQEILNLKKALHEAQNLSEMIKGHVRIIVLQMHREKFVAQLKTAMDKGWMAWAAQATKLHTYRGDFENRKKEGWGFYKLSDDTIASVREDLTKDNQELAEQHSEELAQILDDFEKSQEQLLNRLLEIKGTQYALPVAEPESAEVEGQSNDQETTITHESADNTHSEQTQPIMSPQTETLVVAPITQPDNDTDTPEPNMQEGDIITSPLIQGEGQQPRNDTVGTITPELNQDMRTEPSILDILETE